MPATLRPLALSVSTLLFLTALGLSAVASEESEICTLRGRVTNFFDGTGIPAAWLEIVHPAEGTLEPRTTDAEGFFSVELPASEEELSVSIRKPGYLQDPEIRKVLADRSEVELQVELFPRQVLAASNRVLLIEGLNFKAAEQGNSLEHQIQALAAFDVEDAKIAEILASVHGEPLSPRPQIDSKSRGRPRLAVLEFENLTDDRPGWWLGQTSALQDAFVTELVKSGRFRVLGPENLEALMAEKNFVLSGDVHPSTAVQAGKVLGIDYLLIGAVTQYGIRESDAPDSSSSGPPGFGSHRKTFIAAINARILDARTGEIVWADESRTERSNSRVSVGGFGGGRDNEERMFDRVMEPLVQELAAGIKAAKL